MAGASHTRSLSAPLVPQFQPRLLISDDVEQGSILWLAPFGETLASLQTRRSECTEPVLSLAKRVAPGENFYGHPILVVSRSAKRPDSIVFLPLTSFHGQDITKRFKTHERPYRWPRYLAISPAKNHPLFKVGDVNYRTLHLDDGLPMNKPGYVNVSKVYQMDWRDAQPYWRGDGITYRKTRLSQSSLDIVFSATARFTGYKPKEQYNPRLPVIHKQRLAGPRSWADLVAPNPLERRAPEELLDPLAALPTQRPVAATDRSPRHQIRSDGRREYGGEREPLLPIHYDTYSSGGDGRRDGLFAWFWSYLKKTRLGIILCLLCCCVY